MQAKTQEIHYSDSNRWPRRDQLLLFKAALFRGSPAKEAWEEWCTLVELDYLEPASRQFLPMLYQNLSSQGIQDSALNKLKGVYRSVWYKNQLLFQNMAIVLEIFHKIGIQTLLLKGSAMVLKYYQDYGIRTMSDFDMLIHPENAPAARANLRRTGWIPMYEHNTENLDDYYSLQPSLNFKNEAGLSFDLHWHVFPMCVSDPIEDDFWNGSSPLTFKSLLTHVLDPADQLTHVIVHGQMESPRLFRWIPDAFTIINTTGADFDWQRLIHQSHRLRLIPFMLPALKYLRENFDLPIPPFVLDNLRQAYVSGIERLEYWMTTRPVGIFGDLPKIWFRYLRFRQVRELPPLRFRTGGFFKFLQTYWGIREMRALPGFILTKSVNRIRYILTTSTSLL